MAEVSNRIDGIELATSTMTFYELQESVDNGHQPGRLNPEEVALDFATKTLGFKGKVVLLDEAEKEYAKIEFIKENGKSIHIGLYQPVKKGKGGIWAVECWFDENSKLYQARDLSKLPPLFHNDDNIPEDIKEAFRDAIVTEWTDTFGVYYKVLGFEASDVRFFKNSDKAELKFMLTLVTQNFYRDPDTVAYIKRAKERGSSEYQTLYEEYNLAKEGNIDLMISASLSPDGEIIADTLQVFSNVAFSGEEYAPVKAEDFIIKE